MYVIPEVVQIKKNMVPSVEYIENELRNMNINPLRWAVVHVSDNMYTINIANLKE